MKNTPSRSRRGMRASLADEAHLKHQRAQGMPGAQCAPQPRMQNKKAYEHSHHGHTGTPGIPRAMVLTVSFVISPVTGFVVTVIG